MKRYKSIFKEATLTIKFSKSDKKEIQDALDSLVDHYSFADDYEIDIECDNRKEAEELVDKLPHVRYTIR